MINVPKKTTIKTGINAFTNGILTKVILINHILYKQYFSKKKRLQNT